MKGVSCLLSRLVRSSRSSSLLSSSSSLFGQATYCLRICEAFSTEIKIPARDGVLSKGRSPFVTFVLGGPGCGKGTQCTKIAETFGFTHISAGDLLRQEISSTSKNGAMIHNIIREGKIVPSDVTVNLIKEAIRSKDNHKFLIDGFPRTEENRMAYEHVVGAEPNMVLFFDCPEEIMVKRALGRNQGRVDDNEDTIKKRLEVFRESNLPVINYYSKRGILHTINATGTEEEIFEQVCPIFAAYEPRLR